MKYSIACLAAIAIASSSFAVTLGTAPAVTISLTASETTGGFKIVDPDTKEVSYEYSKSTDKLDKEGNVILTTTEYKTVVSSYRYGNAQLINELYYADLLPDGVVKGWSIVGVTALEDGSSGLFAVKKGQEPVNIEVEILNITGAETSAGKETYSPETEFTTPVSYSYSRKSSLGIAFNGFEFTGIETSSGKYVKASFGKGASAIPYEAYLDGATKVAGINGTYGSSEDEYGALVEGTISTGAEVVLNLETLGFQFYILDPVSPN